MSVDFHAIQKIITIHFSTDSSTIRLVDHFPEELVDGKLLLDKIDFFRLGPHLNNIDFSGCIIRHGDFRFLSISDCDFSDAKFTRCNFHNAVIHQSTIGLNSVSQPQMLKLAFFPEHIMNFEKKLQGIHEKMWFKLTYSKYPLDFLKYDKLSTLSTILVKHLTKNGFFIVYPHGEMIHAEWMGWKIHVALLSKDAKKAFDLIAPTLFKYNVAFRILEIRPFEIEDPLFSTRFTIYLERGGEPTISPEDAYQLVEKITQQFVEADIPPGAPVKADIKTFSPYCSLRNDLSSPWSIYWNKQYYDQGEPGMRFRLAAADVGRCFNPFWHDNPFTNLLAGENPSFCMKTHLSTLPLATIKDAVQSIIRTMDAYANQKLFPNTVADKNFAFTMMLDLIPPNPLVFKDGTCTKAILNGLKVFFRVSSYVFENWMLDDELSAVDFLNSKLINELKFEPEFSAFLDEAARVLGELKQSNPLSTVFSDLVVDNFDSWYQKTQKELEIQYFSLEFGQSCSSGEEFMAELIALAEISRVAKFLLSTIYLGVLADFVNILELCDATKNFDLSNYEKKYNEGYSLLKSLRGQDVGDYNEEEIDEFIQDIKAKFIEMNFYETSNFLCTLT